MSEKNNKCLQRVNDNCQHVTVKSSSGDKPKGEIRFIEHDDSKCGLRTERKRTDVETDLNNLEDDSPVLLVTQSPFYADLGKNARDIFNNGFHFGTINLGLKTKTANTVEFKSNGILNRETSEVFASFESKYKLVDYGLTFSEKWNTDNTLGTEITIQDQFVKGLKLGGNLNFAPESGKLNGKANCYFNNDCLALNGTFDVNNDDLHINGGAVLGFHGWLAGFEAEYDINNKEVKKSNVALGFATKDFVLHSNVNLIGAGENKNQEFGGSIYQKIMPRLETGVQLSWSPDNKNTRFGLGALYELDRGVSVRTKINNACQIGLSYEQRLREGVTITLSTLIDAKTLNGGNHKLGLGIEFEG